MLADARAVGLVPDVFSGPALERCRREIATLAKQLNKTELSATQSGAMAELPSLLAEAADAAFSRDRTRTARVVSALQRARGDLDRATETP
jgi:hypothetical protein